MEESPAWWRSVLLPLGEQQPPVLRPLQQGHQAALPFAALPAAPAVLAQHAQHSVAPCVWQDMCVVALKMWQGAV